MDRLLLVLCAITGLSMIFVSYPDGALSVLLILSISIPAVLLIRHYAEGHTFLINVFLLALLLRIALGMTIYIFDLQGVFGPDAYHYDSVGKRLMEIWLGLPVPNDITTVRAITPGGFNRGMYYLVASIYLIFGSSFLVAQSFCGVVGALVAPMVYFCAQKVFNNQRVSKISAISIAVFPSFVIWSSQLLKDGLIIFLLVCAMIMILQLQIKFSYLSVALLILSLFGILSLRFYIFYMVAISVAGSFIIGLNYSLKSVIRNVIIIVVTGLALTYLGVIRNATVDFEMYGSFERVQSSRQDLAASADSGFGEDLDVSTPAGAMAAIPVGLAYLFFAPFPWEVNKLNQALVLPETFLWWALIPIMLSGLWYTLRHKLRGAIPILTFSLMLTISYSIFQGNVGMLYRQRTQIQVFLFIFIAVGWALIKERRENQQMLRQIQNEQFKRKLQANKQSSGSSI